MKFYVRDYDSIYLAMRDLNYAKYYTEGEEDLSCLDDYTSHNTERLYVEQVKICH